MNLFELSNLLIIPFWLTLLIRPQGRAAARLMEPPWICGVLALLYGSLILPNLGTLLPLLLKPKLEEIQLLLGSPMGATAGWLHFLCLDLFVARCIWRDALERRANLVFLRVCLLLNLLFGPLGLLIYGAARPRTNPL